MSTLRGCYLEAKDGALRHVSLSDPWGAPALGMIELPVHDPVRCRAGVVSWLAFPRIGGSQENQRKKVTAALAGEAWLESIKAGKLILKTSDGERLAKRGDLPDFVREMRKRARESWIEKGLNRANERLQDAEALCFALMVEGARDHFMHENSMQIEDSPDGRTRMVLRRTRNLDTGEVKYYGGMTLQLPARSIRGLAGQILHREKATEDTNLDNIRARRWYYVRHVIHLARAVNLAGDIPANPDSLRRLLDEAESCRLHELPMLGIAVRQSLKFRPPAPKGNKSVQA